jgi:hypothetical protein
MFDPYHKWLAIPPGQRPPTHYQLLGISPTENDADVIEEAALQRIAHLRTYQIGPLAKECIQLLNEVAQAKIVLLNLEKRKAYDEELSQAANAGSTKATAMAPRRRRVIAFAAGTVACAALVVTIAFMMSGNAADSKKGDPQNPPAGGNAEQKPKAPEPRDIVWIDDELPEGAQLTKTTRIWHWGDAKTQPVLSGAYSLKASGAGHHARFFHGATTALSVHAGDTLFAYVWLDPKDPPKAIMLQFYDGNRWDHRAYWGDDLCIAKGEPDTPHHRHRGPLPPTGAWTRLEVSAEAVGFVPDSKINGWGLNQFDGTVYYDKMGIRTTWMDAGILDDSPAPAKKGKKKK